MMLTAGGMVLSACAPAGQPTPTPAPAAPAATPTPAAQRPAATPTPAVQAPGAAAAGTIRFFARGDDAIFKVFRELRDAFQKESQRIKVEIDEVPGDFYQKLQLQVASGVAPDAVFECDCTLGTSVRNNMVHPLDDYLRSERRFSINDFWPISFYASTYNGKRYGLPYDGGSMALFYNKDLFKAAGLKDLDPETPATWDEILNLARQLTLDMNGKRPGESGFDPRRIKQYGLNPAQWAFQAYIYAWGGEVIDEGGKVPIDEPPAVEGLQFLADLGAKHFVAPSPEYQQSIQLAFNTGNVAMEYGGVWNMVRYRANKFEWDVAPFPKGKVKVSLGWYSPLSIMAMSQQKDAAWEWISFCCTEPGQKIVSGLGQAVPTIKKLAQTEYFLNPKVPPKNKEVFLREMDERILRTPGDKIGSYFGGYVREFRQVFGPIFDPVWRGKKTAAEAAKEARPKLEHLLKTGQVT